MCSHLLLSISLSEKVIIFQNKTKVLAIVSRGFVCFSLQCITMGFQDPWESYSVSLFLDTYALVQRRPPRPPGTTQQPVMDLMWETGDARASVDQKTVCGSRNSQRERGPKLVLNLKNPLENQCAFKLTNKQQQMVDSQMTRMWAISGKFHLSNTHSYSFIKQKTTADWSGWAEQWTVL